MEFEKKSDVIEEPYSQEVQILSHEMHMNSFVLNRFENDDLEMNFKPGDIIHRLNTYRDRRKLSTMNKPSSAEPDEAINTILFSDVSRKPTFASI